MVFLFIYDFRETGIRYKLKEFLRNGNKKRALGNSGALFEKNTIIYAISSLQPL